MMTTPVAAKIKFDAAPRRVPFAHSRIRIPLSFCQEVGRISKCTSPVLRLSPDESRIAAVDTVIAPVAWFRFWIVRFP